MRKNYIMIFSTHIKGIIIAFGKIQVQLSLDIITVQVLTKRAAKLLICVVNPGVFQGSNPNPVFS